MLLLVLSPIASLYAAEPVPRQNIEWFALFSGLLGGLALFLFGIEKMSNALEMVAGDQMKTILARISQNRFMGMLTGALVTAIIQSSSVTTVMLVGFVSANLMTFTQTIGVIFGANIGTTITTQIIAFKVTKAALLLIALGVAMIFTGKRELIRQYGYVILGMGLLFQGMVIMGDSVHPLRTYQPFIQLMAQMENPVLGILAAAVFTAMVQASSATLGVVVVLASHGLVSLDGGIAMMLGSNIGTCITAGFASIGRSREAIRVSVAHILFNVLGVLLLLPFLTPYAEFIQWVSPADAGLDVRQYIPRQIANSHTFFNIGASLLFIFFVPVFDRFVCWLVPEKKAGGDAGFKTRHLDYSIIKTPALGLTAVRHEIARMGVRVTEMYQKILPAIFERDEETLTKTRDMDNYVDYLYGEIIKYLGQMSKQTSSEIHTREIVLLMSAVNDLENIGDSIETTMVGLGIDGIKDHIVISDVTRDIILKIYRLVSEALDSSIRAVVEQSMVDAGKVVGLKAAIDEIFEQAQTHQQRRLIADNSGGLAAYRLEMDLIQQLKRVYYHAKRIAKSVINPGEMLKDE
ncbi:MAG: Na/Pi cotransporter family protein [SAR324 cluster bacterium]|nr:Na/Pi cotransporter family protein [SAR324 cluster bacterium]